MQGILVNSGKIPVLEVTSGSGYIGIVGQLTSDFFVSRGTYRAGSEIEADLAAMKPEGEDILAQLGIKRSEDREQKERSMNCGQAIHYWTEQGHELVTVTAFPEKPANLSLSKPLEGMIEVFSRPRKN